MKTQGWIGVDLDGTLAQDHGHERRNAYGAYKIGDPVPAMVARIQAWRAAGQEVRIVTARVASTVLSTHRASEHTAIRAWCLEHLGALLLIQAEKDPDMLQLWDDRAVSVEKNTGACLTRAPVCGPDPLRSYGNGR